MEREKIRKIVIKYTEPLSKELKENGFKGGFFLRARETVEGGHSYACGYDTTD